jgi:hypothetical protein
MRLSLSDFALVLTLLAIAAAIVFLAPRLASLPVASVVLLPASM